MLARWQSDIVMRYFAEAPLLTLTEAYKQGGPTVSGTGIVGKKPETWESIEVVQQKKKRRTEALAFSQVAIEEAAAHAGLAEAAAEAAHDEIQALKDRLFTLEMQALYMSELVVNDSGLGAVHRNLSAFALETPDLWRTACGWRYGKAKFDRSKLAQHGFAQERMCERRFHLKSGVGDAACC